MGACALPGQRDDFAVDHRTAGVELADGICCRGTIKSVTIGGVERDFCPILYGQRSASVSFDFIEPALPMRQHGRARAEHWRDETRPHTVIRLHTFAFSQIVNAPHRQTLHWNLSRAQY